MQLIAVTFVVVLRPRTAPKSALVLLLSIFIVKAIVLTGKRFSRPALICSCFELVMCAGSLAVIFNMPLRDPLLSKEDISPVFSDPSYEFRSPEDNLTLWQFMSVTWMAPLIAVGKNRQLHEEDVWQLAREFQHRELHERFRELKGTVFMRLLKANGIDLVILTVLGIIDTLACKLRYARFGSSIDHVWRTALSVPAVLQQILRAMENEQLPQRVAVTYAVLSLVLRLVSTQTHVFGLWYGRRCYERSRGEIITMLYEKTLNRKIFGSANKAEAQVEASGAASGTETDAMSAPKKFTSGFRTYWDRVLALIPLRESAAAVKDKQKDPASMGKILNLMRADTYEVAQRFWEFQDLITKPLTVVFALILIWRLIGWPCLIGVLTVLIAQFLNAWIAKVLLKWERTRRVATDHKLKRISQFVEAIRHLRWYGWENAWLSDITKSRQHELNLRVIANILNLMIGTTNLLAVEFFPVAAFWAFSGLAGYQLRIDIAFPALQLFRYLSDALRDMPNMITMLLNARVSMGRIQDFMLEPDLAQQCDYASKHRSISEDGQPDGRGSTDTNGSVDQSRINRDGQTEFGLKNASFAWPNGPTVLHDISLSFSTGLTVVYGEVAAGKSALLEALLGELDLLGGELHRPQGMVGYCAQSPWLQSMSIRENILFSAPYEEKRYKAVLEACALTSDLANFKAGDLSLIGENGIGLSGGQRMRVALARAVYSRADILLLDDPISALDHQTADFIAHKCLAGDLTKGRTVVVVTHRLDVCRDVATQAVELVNGTSRVVDMSEFNSEGLVPTKSHEVKEENQEGPNEEQQAAAVPEKFIEEEHRAHGGVKALVYWEYAKAGGKKWWFFVTIFLVLFRFTGLAETLFLKQWGEAYRTSEVHVSSGPFEGLPSPEDNVYPWLKGFAAIQGAKVATFFLSQVFMIIIVYTTGKTMFAAVMERVTHATFRFYDTTPVGRLMNRLTSDINTIDGNISQHFFNVARMVIVWIYAIIVIASVTPVFLLFSFLITVAFVVVFLAFLPTSQSLRRLEMVSLSPLMSNFGALVEGLMTVRAFKAQQRFQDRVIEVVDTFQKMDHFYWSLQAWLMYRFDILSDFSTLIITLIALGTGVSPGLTAFVLMYAYQFVTATHSLCRTYGQLQMDFVSG